MQTSQILKDIFTTHDEKCILKLDCEGAEYDILEDLICSGVISKIDIIMEWHLGRYKELNRLLEKWDLNFC